MFILILSEIERKLLNLNADNLTSFFLSKDQEKLSSQEDRTLCEDAMGLPERCQKILEEHIQ